MFSRQEVPGGSLPAFARRHVALRRNAYLTHYRSAFAFSAILYPHRHRQALQPAVPEGSDTGLPRSVSQRTSG